MGDTTGIQWTDHTWNPWRGCTKVSPGCDACYMFRDMRRYGRDPEAVVRAAPATFGAPLTWERRIVTGARGPGWPCPQRVFTCSWSDWFHPAADGWRDEAWAVIRDTPHLTYQILTKRPNRIAGCLPPDWGAQGYPNVWLGTTCESGAYLWRTRYLHAVPAAVRFVSYEPAVGPLATGEDPAALDALTGIDWLIIGGESGGHEARPFPYEWAEGALELAEYVGAAAFVKQLGSVWARNAGARHPHGGDPAEWPAWLRVRQFPEVAVASEARQAVLL